uniref:Uncharacterized protein n=1 Tax=Strigamia maritima TaxID=126957 RepID=T1IYI6_STRMM
MIKYIAFILILSFAAANRNKGNSGGPYLISYPMPIPFIGYNNHGSGGGGHDGGYGGSYSSHGGPYLIDANDVIWAEPPKGYY